MVDLNQVVRETLALRAYEQRVTNITVIDALAAGLPQVFADAHQMQQVLLNLVINAEQAMLSAHGRGTLVVRTWHERGPRARSSSRSTTTGPGVPEDVQPKIFDPFFTTKEVGKGTGLGLTVAYAIVQEHGGRIRVESRPGAARRSSSSCRSGGTRPRAGAGTDRAAARGARRHARARRRGRAGARRGRGRGAGGRGLPGRSGGRRRRGARARGRARLRPDRLRPEDAAARRHVVLPRDCSRPRRSSRGA